MRTVWQARWIPWASGFYPDGMEDSGLRFEIVANAFLYHMVRRLVYIQVQIGQGKLSIDALAQAFETGTVQPAGLAPAQGLTLLEVQY